jgi:hypothetical protein
MKISFQGTRQNNNPSLHPCGTSKHETCLQPTELPSLYLYPRISLKSLSPCQYSTRSDSFIHGYRPMIKRLCRL